MLAKINISGIVRDHVGTLRNNDSGRYSVNDMMLFYAAPIMLGAGLAVLKVDLHKDLVNALITALSVFAALLFNLLLLVYDIVKKENQAQILNRLKSRFLKEIYSNASYAIFVAILTIVFLLLSLLRFKAVGTLSFAHYVKGAFSGIIGALLANFILTLFMLLKRVHVLLSNEMK